MVAHAVAEQPDKPLLEVRGITKQFAGVTARKTQQGLIFFNVYFFLLVSSVGDRRVGLDWGILG